MTDADKEIERVVAGASVSDIPEGFDVEKIYAHCSGDAKAVLSKSREALHTVLSVKDSWPDSIQWRSLLPAWFVEASGEERTKEESEIWRKRFLLLPRDKQAEVLQQERWSVDAWTFWFKPGNENRQWRWWNATLVRDDLLVIEIEVNDWPIAWGSLEWLLRASGARSVEAE